MAKVDARRAAALTMIGLVFVLAPQACGSDEPPTKAIGDGCFVPTDCIDPLVCVFQRCHKQCLSDRDCDAKQTCAGASAPKKGVCLFEDETNCSRNSDCPLVDGRARLVCGRRLRCETQCANTSDCLASQTCAQGSCVDSLLVPEGGPPPVAGKSGETCIQTSDCNAPLVCKFGFCADECVTARDCADPATYTCVERTCHRASDFPDSGVTDGTTTETPPTYGKPCLYPSECDAPLTCRSSGVCGWECVAGKDCKSGEYCSSGHTCIFGSPPDGGVDSTPVDSGSGTSCAADDDCKAGSWCNPERCVAKKCKAVDGPCVTHTACTTDACDEATKTCTHTPTTKLDADGDGHTALDCGGDDCDDKDNTVYTGAPELCDLKDNDCDVLIDDYAVGPRPPELVTTLSSTSFKQLEVSPMGPKWFVAIASGPSSSAPPGLSAFTYDVTGAPSAEKSLDTGTIDLGRVTATKDHAVLVYEKADGARYAKLLRSDLSEVATAPLTAPGAVGFFDAASAWDGSNFFLAWVNRDFSTQFTFLKTDGTLTGGVKYIPDGASGVGAKAPFRAAAKGAVHALAYTNASSRLTVLLLSSSGGEIASVDVSGSVTNYSLMTTTSGLGVVWTTAIGVGKMYFTPISTTGVKGADIEIQSGPYFAQMVAVPDDATGIAVVSRGFADGSLRFLWSGVAQLPSPPPLESTTPFPASPAGENTIAFLPGPQFGLFNLETGGKLRSMRIGCLP